MKEEVIEYLYDNNTGNKIRLNDFLQTLLTNNNQKILQSVLLPLEKEGLVNFDGMVGHIGETTYEIENHAFSGVLTASGIKEGKEIKRIKRQDRLLEEQGASMIATNKSIQNTNASTQANFASQQAFAARSLWLAGISSAFILATIVLQSLDKTPQQLQDIKTELQQTKQKLDSIRLSLEEINSSMKSVTTDTLLVKRSR